MEMLREQVNKVSDLGKQVIVILQEYDEAFPYASKEDDDRIASDFVVELRKLAAMVNPPAG
jgi:hypothetical protein